MPRRLDCVKLLYGSIGCHHNKLGICLIKIGGLQIKLGNDSNKIGKLFKYIGILLVRKVMTWEIKRQRDWMLRVRKVSSLNDFL